MEEDLPQATTLSVHSRITSLRRISCHRNRLLFTHTTNNAYGLCWFQKNQAPGISPICDFQYPDFEHRAPCSSGAVLIRNGALGERPILKEKDCPF
jgi:hypothetical protein